MVVAVLGIGVASWIAFVIIAVVVVALAGYLIAVASLLNKVHFTLGTVVIGVRAIAEQTEPIDDVITGIAEDVAAIQVALRSLLPGPRATKRALRSLPGRPRARSGTTGRV